MIHAIYISLADTKHHGHRGTDGPALPVTAAPTAPVAAAAPAQVPAGYPAAAQ
jgi:hypothetical protein